MEHMRARVASLGALFLLLAAPGGTQINSKNRIARAIDSENVAAVRGTAHPLAQSRFDQGRLSPAQQLSGVTLTFRLSAAQQSDLDRLLREQQDPSSPNYHKWLTPEQYASRFGMTQNDLAKVTSWLQSQGLAVDGISRSRTEISFSGTVGQVEYALKTELHNYSIKGEQHFANATDVALPAAFSREVLDVRGLNNFHPKPRFRRLSPRFTSSISGNHFVIPGDFATIYDLGPLYSQGLDGAGQTIAVMGQTAISLSDIDAFRAASGLSKYEPTLLLVPNTGNAPTCSDDEGEADLDLEWSGAVAKNASIIYVYVGVGTGACGKSRTKDVFDALQYAIANNVAPVISISYGNCEANLGTFVNTMRQWAQQANAQGQTISGPSGDDGAADCDFQVSSATHGLAVDVPASIPEVTGVGGTEFTGDTTQCPGSPPSCPGGVAPADPPYWGGSSSPTSGASALIYIPEKTWNDTSQSLALVPPKGFAASGGGASTIFTKAQAPWQTGPGVPNDGKRDVPDISLNASNFHDPALFCTAGSCVNGFRDANGGLSGVGGTSLGAPSFAGILAIINQATQATAGQGNVNPNLYSLAVSKPLAFNDITSGDNKVPCTTGTQNCPSGTSSIGFTAGANYDQVTGLGSPDAFNLVTAWPGFVSTSAFAVGASPTRITIASAGQGGSGTVVVGGANGFTGTVALSCSVGNAATAHISCALNPSSIALSTTTTSGTAALSISTAAVSSAIQREHFGVLAATLVLPGIFLLAGPTGGRRKMLRFLAIGLITFLPGCGGGGSHTTPTPAGTYSITVTGTSGSTHSTTISLTVQ
jgi:subtilase family serine protease